MAELAALTAICVAAEIAAWAAGLFASNEVVDVPSVFLVVLQAGNERRQMIARAMYIFIGR
jgi:hypothetical protein